MKKLKLNIEVDESGQGKIGGTRIHGDNEWLTITYSHPDSKLKEFFMDRKDFNGLVRVVVEADEALKAFDTIK